MDETNDKKDEQKTEFGLKDSDFASSKPKSDTKVEEEKMVAVVEKSAASENNKKQFIPKKGFLTLPISDILRDFLNESKSLAKDTEWIGKSLAGFFGVNAMLSFVAFYMQAKTGMNTAGASNFSLVQGAILLVLFVLAVIATTGMYNVVIKKVLFKENVDMFLYDATVIRLLKKTILCILAVLGIIVLSCIVAMILGFVLATIVGPSAMIIVPVLTAVVAIYVSARFLLLLPATVDGGDVSLHEAFKWTGGYASSLIVIVLIYGVLYLLFMTLITMVVSFTHVKLLVIFVNVVFSLINQVLTITLFTKIYQFFKKNNMLG